MLTVFWGLLPVLWNFVQMYSENQSSSKKNLTACIPLLRALLWYIPQCLEKLKTFSYYFAWISYINVVITKHSVLLSRWPPPFCPKILVSPLLFPLHFWKFSLPTSPFFYWSPLSSKMQKSSFPFQKPLKFCFYVVNMVGQL